MNTPPHAKNAKVAKDCTKENSGFGLWYSPALLGALGALGVMRSVNAPTDSHAKNAKVAKDCTKENSGFELWSPALLAPFAPFA
jgi:hypothetical protein